ncbi:dihydroorotase [Aphanothece sacrum]|uniref:Dihydroorotase n=1 Tax=Aphanothece sacrum FPU1 TaxID=1920663 RepID=A0A401IF21_APHSA|nr:dihydroorotase [Aphanothece sacrum]GBF79873.1 dihydroorotase [Aphanothece sacrum FPU1]GBF83907.1 dihydroorotase [Aphanothece sacrum FPU3]
MTTHSLILFRQIRLLDPVNDTDIIRDILINNNIIQAIEPQIDNITPETQIFEAENLIIGPGLMDLYSYSGEPGYEDRETLISLTNAAAAGGFTDLVILPQTVPPIDNCATLAFLQQQSKSLDSQVNLHFWGHLTHKGEGEKMTELVELSTAGVVGFTDNKSIENLGLLRRFLEYINPLNKPIALVPEAISLKGNGVMREGICSINYGLPGNPEMTETTAIATILEMVAVTQTPVHLMRISTSRGVELIATGKARGLPITASTTWLHLLLDTENLANYDSNLKVNPPLGNKEDRQALIEGINQGVIDAIAVDHQAYTYEEKTVPFAEAPPGVIGLELALPLLWQEFVVSGQWSALQLWKVLSVNSRQCLGHTLNLIQVGESSNFIVFDPEKVWKVTPSTLNSLGSNTSWLGQEIKGKVLKIK